MSQTIRRALLSVSNKEGLLEFARALRSRGVELLSTGGTAAMLREAGIEVTDVSAVTGFPEMMDGRVKTLHPKIHGGLLGRGGTDDAVLARARHRARSTSSSSTSIRSRRRSRRPAARIEEAIENIDIGGPSMVRAAAKNHERVTVVVDPVDYGTVLAEIEREGGSVSAETRRRAGGQGVRAHRRVRRGDRGLPRPRRRAAAPRARFPRPARAAVPQAPRPALRREPAPAGRVLRRHRHARAHRWARPRSCRARSCPTTTSSTWTPPSSSCASSTRPPA